MKSQTLYLNRVVIPHLRQLYKPHLVDMGNFPNTENFTRINGIPIHLTKSITLFNPATLQIYTNALFSQSAEKVYVVSLDKRTFAEDTANLALVAKSRIQLADQKGKIYQDVKDFFKPIFKDAISAGIYNPSLERYRQFDSSAPSNFRFAGHVLHRLAKETYLFCVATKLKAQVDLNLNNYRNLIKATKELRLSHETISKLSILEGIVTPYRGTTVDSFHISQDYGGKSVSERLFDLLADAKIQDLSHERYLLGIPAKLKLAQQRIRMLVREILNRPKYQSLLSAGKDIVSAATHTPIPTSYLTDIVLGEAYSPPLISLTKLKPKPKSKHYPSNNNDTDNRVIRSMLLDEERKIFETGKYNVKVRYKEYLDELVPNFTFSEPIEKKIEGGSIE